MHALRSRQVLCYCAVVYMHGCAAWVFRSARLDQSDALCSQHICRGKRGGMSVVLGRRCHEQYGVGTKNDCISPSFNFIQGYFAVAFGILLGSQYLFRGRFHRVAFVRLIRVLGPLGQRTQAVINYVSYVNIKADSERLQAATHRRKKKEK